jgi:hypothetical protein
VENIVFTFCRMNPPTKGHAKLIAFIQHLATESKSHSRIYVSRSHDEKSNPLELAEKLDFIRTSFPHVEIRDAHTVFTACKEMASEGYENAVLVVGEDRKSSFEQTLPKYVNHEDPTKDIGLKSVKVVGIPRSPDDYSATKARSLVAAGDFEHFIEMTPIQDLAVVQKMFNCIRQGMGIKNE